MKIGLFPRSPFVPVVIAVGAVLSLGMVALAVQAAQPSHTIEIVINKNGEGKVVSGSTVHGLPTEISVRNDDSVTHGFNSSMLNETMKVEMSGGIRAEKEGANVFRVEPGKTMVLKFHMPPQPGKGTRTYAFWCDMHSTMKGEMEVVGVEVGEF